MVLGEVAGHLECHMQPDCAGMGGWSVVLVATPFLSCFCNFGTFGTSPSPGGKNNKTKKKTLFV